MTKKDFFRLLIKIFGLYALLVFIFTVLPSNFILLFQHFDAPGIFWIAVHLTVTVLIYLFLIYNPGRIISWLKLDKGFEDDRIDFQKFNNANILKLALILIGGFLLVQNIPTFLSFTFLAFRSSVGGELNAVNYSETKHYIQWVTSFLNILIGYLLLTNYNLMSRILKEKQAARD